MKVDYRVIVFFLITIILSVTSCSKESEVTVEEPVLLPTPANLNEVINNLSSEDIRVRVASIYELEKHIDSTSISIPYLILSLQDKDFDVRRAAAYVLGKFGDKSDIAVPDLIYMLKNDESIYVRKAVAQSLGQIGNKSSIPALSEVLYEVNNKYDFEFQILSAKSISQITGEKFTDVDSLTFTLNDERIPLIIIDAKMWWEEYGKFQDWSTP